MKKITIQFIPHRKQRLSDVGDYFERARSVEFRISHMKDDYDFLVLLHELVEWFLTKKRGITIQQIDAFDLQYKGKESGASKSCPYRNEHVFATKLEKLMAKELGVKWRKYERKLDEITKHEQKNTETERTA